MPSEYMSRMTFDMIFFIVIIIIMLNIVFGIVIDQFASLRDEKNINDYDRNSRCFICNIEKEEFQKEGLSFNNHKNLDHNQYNYLYYIIYLQYKDNTEYNGIEDYVFGKFINNDLSWFPINSALCFERDGGVANGGYLEDAGLEGLKKMIGDLKSSVEPQVESYNKSKTNK